MLEPRPLTTLWASTACYRDSFTFLSRWRMNHSSVVLTESRHDYTISRKNTFVKCLLSTVINATMTAPFEWKEVWRSVGASCLCIFTAAPDILSQLLRRQGLPQYGRMKVTQSAWPWKLGHELTRSLMYLFIRWPCEVSIVWPEFRILTSLRKWRRK
jgi:hypothetical protein